MPFKKNNKIGSLTKGHKAWNKGLKIDREKYPNMGFQKGNVPWAKERTGKTAAAYKNGNGIIFKEVLIRDDWSCIICGLRDPEIMEVDHIKPKALFPELKYDKNNLQTLCPNCHRRKSNREIKNIRLKLMFNMETNENGNNNIAKASISQA